MIHQPQAANNIQNSSNTVSGKATDKDDTAVFPLPSQISQANPEQHQLENLDSA